MLPAEKIEVIIRLPSISAFLGHIILHPISYSYTYALTIDGRTVMFRFCIAIT